MLSSRFAAAGASPACKQLSARLPLLQRQAGGYGPAAAAAVADADADASCPKLFERALFLSRFGVVFFPPLQAEEELHLQQALRQYADSHGPTQVSRSCCCNSFMSLLQPPHLSLPRVCLWSVEVQRQPRAHAGETQLLLFSGLSLCLTLPCIGAAALSWLGAAISRLRCALH